VFRKSPYHHIGWNRCWQSLLASVFIGIVLYFFSFFEIKGVAWALGLGALSSSAYIVLGSPSKKSAQIKNIVGGYLIALVVGLLMHYLNHQLNAWLVLHQWFDSQFWIAFVVGLMMLLMSVLKLYHPPAAGLSIVLVLDDLNMHTPMLVAGSALVLVLLKFSLDRYLVDLF
jgi:CBS-domain-containing membrane protein